MSVDESNRGATDRNDGFTCRGKRQKLINGHILL